jgi:hypothetical protein
MATPMASSLSIALERWQSQSIRYVRSGTTRLVVVSFGQLLENYRSNPHFKATLFNGFIYALILTIDGFGYILGDFFTTSSGHPAYVVVVFIIKKGNLYFFKECVLLRIHTPNESSTQRFHMPYKVIITNYKITQITCVSLTVNYGNNWFIQSTPRTDVMILKIVSPKKIARKLAFFTTNTVKL